MTPTVENRAANSLAENIQNRNIRRYAVNARITAVVWGLEFIANLCFVVIWIFIVGTSSTGGLTNSMAWYYVILPYTLLMNTEYNKDRVIDDGWKSVVLNSVKSLFRCIPKRRLNEEENNHSTEKNSDTKTCINNNSGAAPRMPESNVSVISLEDKPNESDEKPCTSDGRHAAHDDDTTRNTFRNQISTDSEADDYKGTERKSRRLRIGENILSSMWHNLNDEEAYSHYFRQLLDLEDPENKNMMNHYNTFQMVPFNKQDDKIESLNTENSVSNEQINGCSTNQTRRLKNSQLEEVPLHVTFLFGLVERTKQRQGQLEEFLRYCDDETAYENFVEELISFEEGLVLD